MSTNVGTLDRIVRALLGALLLYLAFFSGSPVFDGGLAQYGAAILGGILVIVAALRTCPIYSILSIKTCRG